jgi:hypothetical protein
VTTREIRQVAEREPWRPFSVRLGNGTQYDFRVPRDFGAPRDYHVIHWFGETEVVLIAPETITEVVY